MLRIDSKIIVRAWVCVPVCVCVFVCVARARVGGIAQLFGIGQPEARERFSGVEAQLNSGEQEALQHVF